MSLPNVAVDWTVFCDCGISWSYLLAFYVDYIEKKSKYFLALSELSYYFPMK